MDSTNSDEEDSSSQGKPSERPKAIKGSDARVGINLKSTNETRAGSGSGVYFKEGTNRKKDTFEGMPMVTTAQDMLRRDSTGLKGEHISRKSWDANCEMEAHLILGDPFDLRGNIFKEKGWDAYSEMEAQMLLLKESGENNLDDGLRVSMVPWYLAESQPTIKYISSPTTFHMSQTLLSPLPSDSKKKHKETLTKGVSSYRGSQSNSNADLGKCLADFTKRVRVKKANSVKKKKSKYSTPKNQSLSLSEQGS
ncbi:hypothetical protein Ancab_013452 [Ancistrocladus abbreviatus]